MEAMKAVVLTALTSMFLGIFIGIPVAIITGVWIPIAVFGTIAILCLFIEMFIIVLDS